MFSLLRKVFESFQAACSPTEIQPAEVDYYTDLKLQNHHQSEPKPVTKISSEDEDVEPQFEEESKTRQISRPSRDEPDTLDTEEKAVDDRLTIALAGLLAKLGMMPRFLGYNSFVERWMRLDAVMREHKVRRDDLKSALNLLLLYRGSESKQERTDKIKQWCEELEEDDGYQEELYNYGLNETSMSNPEAQFYEWGVLKLKDCLAQNLKKRVNSRKANIIKPGTIASIPAELMEGNLKLKMFQANALLKEFPEIDIGDPNFRKLNYDSLRIYLQNRGKPSKRPAEPLSNPVIKKPKLKGTQSATETIIEASANPIKVRSCRKLSLDCLQKWVKRKLPCRFCKKKIYEPCSLCKKDIAASNSIMFFECRHFMHKTCVVKAHLKEKKCSQCLKAYKSAPIRLN